MRRLPGVLLALALWALAAWPALAQAPEVRVPAGLHGAGVERAMPVLARETLAAYRAAHPEDAEIGRAHV